MLVIYGGAFGGVNLLYLVQNIAGNFFTSFVSEKFLKVDVSFRQLLSRGYLVAYLNEKQGGAGNRVIDCLFVGFLFLRSALFFNVNSYYFNSAFLFYPFNYSVCRGQYGLAFRRACLEKFFDARQTMRNVETGRAPYVKCTERELSPGFTDGLSGNHADSLSDFYRLVLAKVESVAAAAESIKRFA